jgi:hypothetical protein
MIAPSLALVAVEGFLASVHVRKRLERLHLVMLSAIAVGFAGVRVLRRFNMRSLVSGERVTWSVGKPGRRLGQGMFWSLKSPLAEASR